MAGSRSIATRARPAGRGPVSAASESGVQAFPTLRAKTFTARSIEDLTLLAVQAFTVPLDAFFFLHLMRTFRIVVKYFSPLLESIA